MNDQSDQITELKMTAKKPKNRKTAKSIKPKNRNFLLIGLSENNFRNHKQVYHYKIHDTFLYLLSKPNHADIVCEIQSSPLLIF